MDAITKRKFLQLFGAACAGPMFAPALAWARRVKLTNWAGNVEYSTERLDSVGSLDDVRAYVKAQPRLKVLGTRHCFNRIADSTDTFLALRPTDQVMSVDAAAKTVTIGGAVTYGQLAPFLHSRGYALHNLASLPHISVAGGSTTGTHGSGEKNGSLSTAVSGLQIVTASGDVVELTRAKDGDVFRGAVVGLGALGVITRLTLDIQPTFMVRQWVYENLPLDQMVAHFDDIQASGYSVSLFTDWQQKRINEVWIKSRADATPAFTGPATFFGATRATKHLHPIAALSAENCTEQMGVPGPWYERLPHFKMGFTPSAGKELQSEYWVPRRNAVDAILAVERLRDQVTPHLFISEIRTIAADDLWMSPAYQRPSVAIHFTWKQEVDAVARLMPIIEQALAPYGVRPHWGKLFTIAPAELKARYSRMPDFIRLARTHDPEGKFQNAFLRTNVFGA